MESTTVEVVVEAVAEVEADTVVLEVEEAAALAGLMVVMMKMVVVTVAGGVAATEMVRSDVGDERERMRELGRERLRDGERV